MGLSLLLVLVLSGLICLGGLVGLAILAVLLYQNQRK
jgi:hypothetical protein